MRAAILLLLAIATIVLAEYPLAGTRNIGLEDLVKIRCSLDSSQETFFFFNGSVYAYTESASKQLFKTIGINVGRCWKKDDGSYVLASRELLYYVDPATDKIIDDWVNPYTGQTVHVAHVDNDPVLQNFPVGVSYPLLVSGEHSFLPLDVALRYPNPLGPILNPTNTTQFAAYSPQSYYQAGEYFKFIFPSKDLDSDADTVSDVLVSWTRTGPFLPWMTMGSTAGYLAYSSQGSRIPDWTYMPASVVSDLENRIPHYKNAPSCIPNTTSVTSWSFFKNKFAQWSAGAQFPLSTPAVYSCLPNPTPAPSSACRAVASIAVQSTWISNGETYYTYVLSFNNIGTKDIKALNVTIGNTVVDSAWNINRQGDSNVHSVTLWNTFGAGKSLADNSYGFRSHSGSAVVSVTSVKC